MNRILTNFLHWIFRMDNKAGLTIPQIQQMKKMSPKQKKAFIKKHATKGKHVTRNKAR